MSSANNDFIFLSLPLQSNWNLEVQQTSSIWILTTPEKDQLVHVATALLKRAEEFSRGGFSFSAPAEEVGVEKVEQWILLCISNCQKGRQKHGQYFVKTDLSPS